MSPMAVVAHEGFSEPLLQHYREVTTMDENLRPEEQPPEEQSPEAVQPEDLLPDELRLAAHYVEATARSALAQFSTIPIPRYSGGPTDFPRATQPDQAAEEGVGALRQVIGQAV